jgi:hypothetical protein
LDKELEIETWGTRRVEGTKPLGDYAFMYKNTYDNFSASETIRLIREQDGQIRIVFYNVASDGFLSI